MAKTPSLLSTLRNEMLADTVSKNKAGNYVFRKGYFYTHGSSEDTLADRVSKALLRMGVEHTIVNKGNKWVPFKGGHTTAQGSHFWVEISIH